MIKLFSANNLSMAIGFYQDIPKAGFLMDRCYIKLNKEPDILLQLWEATASVSQN